MSVPSNFFASASYAVVGASSNTAKYGYKVLRWYIDHDLPVTPVHPTETEIEGIKAVRGIEELPNPQTCSLSIITPPKISLEVIKSAQQLGVPALWLQPGAADAAAAHYIRENGVNAAHSGPCILVLGEARLREQTQQRSAL